MIEPLGQQHVEREHCGQDERDPDYSDEHAAS